MKIEQFFELHPKDQAIYFLESDSAIRQEIITMSHPKIAASFFEQLEVEDAAKIFAKYDINIIVDIINEMNSDDVTKIFREVDPLTRNRYLSLLDKIHAQKIREILQYDEDTAGGIMEKNFFYIKSKHSVKKAKELLLSLTPTVEFINYLYILSPKFELIGVISLKDLILGDDDLLVTELMTKDVKAVNVNTDVMSAASLVRDYDFYALPVINDNNQMQGLITVDDIIDVITDDAKESIKQLSGASTTSYRSQLLEKVGVRLPWLILLLFMTLFNANVIAKFDNVIATFPVLASYMTLVAAMSGNVGTQTLGLTIYRLSQDEEFDTFKDMLKYAFSEIKVYLIVGLCLSVLIFVVIGVIYNNYPLAQTLCATITISFMISTCLGTLIPITLDKLKINSQVASGPLITTVNDLIAVVTFLTIGSILM